jgi:polyribonucleotide nucleotidyltransferase
MTKTFRLNEFGYEVEIGKVARQADGAAFFKQGGTVLLATAVSAESRDFPGFFPLTVDYREYFSAAGKIPGGYYKREGKSSDYEVLTGRLIDRAIRPLFPEYYFDQVQVIATVYSVDKEHSPSVMALTAASIALMTSKIPFVDPVAGVEICRIDGKWVINPQYKDMQRADARLVIAGTAEGICMVEGSAHEISEQEFIDALFVAHDAVKRIVAWQHEIVAAVAAQKVAIADPYSWKLWEERVLKYLNEGDHIKSLYTDKKADRNTYMAAIKQAFNEQYKSEIETADIPANVLDYVFDAALEPLITERIFELKKRVDGRSYEQIRPISVEVGQHSCSIITSRHSRWVK